MDVILNHVSTCEELARSAGELLLQWRGRVSVREKGRADLVTEADLASQNLLQSRIAALHPDHRFIGEEGEAAVEMSNERKTIGQGRKTAGTASDFCWIVDPLDGTTNYVHGLPGWCVSIALLQDEHVIAGCVFDPVREACFTAGRGQGAFANGQPICTSDVVNLRDALVAVSFPASVKRDSPEIAYFLDLLPEIQAFRRLGSAALNLCYLACGQIDAYWANSVNAWDVAAGVLLVREAGGRVSSPLGEPFDLRRPKLAAAANASLHSVFVERFRRCHVE